MSIQRLTRIFKKGPTRLLDPDPAMTPEQVLEHYTDLFPELANATVSEPETVGTELVYTFEKPIVKTKGVGEALPQIRKGTALILAHTPTNSGEDAAELMVKRIVIAAGGGRIKSIYPEDLEGVFALGHVLEREPDFLVVNGLPKSKTALEKVKRLITDPKVTCDVMLKQPRVVDSPNLIFLSGDTEAIKPYLGERRYSVVNVDA